MSTVSLTSFSLVTNFIIKLFKTCFSVRYLNKSGIFHSTLKIVNKSATIVAIQLSLQAISHYNNHGVGRIFSRGPIVDFSR